MITKEGFTQLNIIRVHIQTHVPKVIEIKNYITSKQQEEKNTFFPPSLANNHLYLSCEFNEINARIKIDREVFFSIKHENKKFEIDDWNEY